MRKRSRLLTVTAVCVTVIAAVPSAHAAIGIPEVNNILKLAAADSAVGALPIVRGGFGGAAEDFGVAHG